MYFPLKAQGQLHADVIQDRVQIFCLITWGSSWAIPRDSYPLELVGHTALGGVWVQAQGPCRLVGAWGDVSPAPWALQSLVLVSRLPFVRLFQTLLSLIAPEYFDKLAPCLEAGEWPPDIVRLISASPPSTWDFSRLLLLGAGS